MIRVMLHPLSAPCLIVWLLASCLLLLSATNSVVAGVLPDDGVLPVVAERNCGPAPSKLPRATKERATRVHHRYIIFKQNTPF